MLIKTGETPSATGVKKFAKVLFGEKNIEAFQLDANFLHKILTNTYKSFDEAKELVRKKEGEKMQAKKKCRKTPSNKTTGKKNRTEKDRKHDASNNLEEVDQATRRISANQLTQVVYDPKSDSISTAATNHTEENIEDGKEENVDKGKCGTNKEEDNSASITKRGSKKDENSSASIHGQSKL